MAVKLTKTQGDIWGERFAFVLKIGGLLALEFVVFLGLLRSGVPYVAPILSIVLSYLTWQLVARVVTGSGFEFRVILKVNHAEDLRDALSTAFFFLNSVLFVYTIVDF